MKQLQDMILPEKAVSFEFPGCPGLEFELAYLARETVQKLVRKSTRTKIDRRTRQPVEESDNDLFLELYVKAVIKGWKGFKFKYLDEFVIWDQSEDAEDELEFTAENALFLMKNSQVLDDWVANQIADLGNFMSPSSKKKKTRSSDTSGTVKAA
jgi:hypothetical protein